MKLRTAIATATTAAVLATSGVALAGAATNPGTHATTAAVTTKAPATRPAPHAAKERRVRVRKLIRKGAVKVISATIGIDKATLRKDLLAGQTIAVIAGNNGSSAGAVITALVTAATAKLNAAATAGKIKPARVTKIEATLTARVTKFVDTWLPKKAKATAA